jgi:hypothetical protein
LDRVVMGRYYFVPMFYDNTIYWAYWADRVEFPPFNPLVGTNTLEWWWAKPTPIVADKGITKSSESPGFGAWIQSKLSWIIGK